MLHCLNICIFPNTGKYGPEKYQYLDTFHIVLLYRMKQNWYQIFRNWYLNNISVESKILAFWNFTSTSLISWCCLHVFLTSLTFWHVFNPLSANPTKWPNILKQFVGKLPTNSLNVFDYFVKLVLKGWSRTFV